MHPCPAFVTLELVKGGEDDQLVIGHETDEVISVVVRQFGIEATNEIGWCLSDSNIGVNEDNELGDLVPDGESVCEMLPPFLTELLLEPQSVASERPRCREQ